MSWFDTAKLAKLASQAMKDAQMTLDSALDIKNEEVEENEDIADIKSPPQQVSAPVTVTEVPVASQPVWGAFSGSFVESQSVSRGGGGEEARAPELCEVSLDSPARSPSPAQLQLVTVISPEPESEPELQTELEPQSNQCKADASETIEAEAGEEEVENLLELAMAESSVATSLSRASSELVRMEAAGSETASSEPELVGQSGSEPEVGSSRSSAGHTRHGSDLSSGGSLECGQPGQTEEQLSRQNKVLAELLAAREDRLVAVSRDVAQLQEEGAEMAGRLEAAAEEFHNEKNKSDGLKIQNHELLAEKTETQGQLSRLETELRELKKVFKKKVGEEEENDEIVADLRSEGEALAKQNGKQAEIIRKLRAKEKTQETELSRLKTDNEKNLNEAETLKKSLASKNSVEGVQSENIKKLTDANLAWEAENKKVKNDLEDNVEKVLGLRSSLEAAYKEMAEMKRKLEEAAGEAAAAALSKEISLREEAVRSLTEERRGWGTERVRLEQQIESLQTSLQLVEEAGREREEHHRQEAATMQRRLEEADRRQEQLADCAGQATRPLLRQVETLQAGLREARAGQEAVERSLGERLQQAEHGLAGARERERAARESAAAGLAKLAGLEERASIDRQGMLEAKTRAEELEGRLRLAEEVAARERRERDRQLSGVSDQLETVTKEKQFLTASLETEKLECESRRQKSVALVEQLKERDKRVRDLQQELEMRQLNTSKESSVSLSPTPSLGQFSVSAISDSWTGGLQERDTDLLPGYYEAGRLGNTAALVESLQAQLKQREGEVGQLVVQQARADQLRESLNQELTRLTIQADQGEEFKEEVSLLKTKLVELEQKYQTMLTMYGEKVEECEELRLDLEDVKEMYKMQIDQLTNIQNPS